MIKENVTITGIEPSGHGSAPHENGKILVLGVFPGDIIDVHIYKQVGDYYYAEAIHFSAYSEFRSDTETHFPANIPWQRLSLDAEYAFKNTFLKNYYTEYLNQKESLFHEAKQIQDLRQNHYRNKVAYAFKENEKGQLEFALYSRGQSKIKKESHQQNILVHEQITKGANIFLNFFNQQKLSAQDIKYLILRYSYHENNIVAHILVPENNRKKIAFKKSDLEKCIQKHEYIKGILVSFSPAGVRSALSHKDFYHIGDIDIQEQVLDKKYYYHPSLFFQIYPKAFEEILKDLRLEIKKIDKHQEYELLDLFAGIGIIGLSLADLVKKVRGVELSSLSKIYAEKNAEKNNINNFTFTESSVDGVLDYINSKQILVVDPTRSGLSKATTTAINNKKPQYIFYISCNPASQARDIQNIQKHYDIIFIKGYNLFPKTHHFESLLILRKK